MSTAGTMMSTYTLIDISILCTFFTRVMFLDATVRSASRLYRRPANEWVDSIAIVVARPTLGARQVSL